MSVLLSAAHRRNAAAGPSYLLSEDWEGTGTPSGWTHSTGDILPDYTTTILDGAQSLYVPTPRAADSPSFAAQSELWLYCMFRFVNAPTSSNRYLLGLYNSGGSAVGLVAVASSSLTPAVRHGTLTGSSGSDLALNTTYHLWFHWKKGTGSNGEAEAYISTTATRPGSPQVTINNGDAITDAVSVRLGMLTAGSGNKIFDKLRVSASEIGSNPT
jgi:hypothetical protein